MNRSPYTLRHPMRRRVIRWSALGTVVPAVLLFAGAPAPAAASCGDYVHIGNPAGGESAADASHRGAPPGRGPCNGVYCSSRPAAPSPEPIPDAGQGRDHRALLPAEPPPGPSAEPAHFSPDDRGRPVHRPSPVYRPPR